MSGDSFGCRSLGEGGIATVQNPGVQHNKGFSGPKAKINGPRFNGVTKHVANTYL